MISGNQNCNYSLWFPSLLRHIIGEKGKRMWSCNSKFLQMYMSLFNCLHMRVFMGDSGLIHDLLRSSATIVLLSRATGYLRGSLQLLFLYITAGWNASVKWQIAVICDCICVLFCLCQYFSAWSLFSGNQTLKSFFFISLWNLHAR